MQSQSKLMGQNASTLLLRCTTETQQRPSSCTTSLKRSALGSLCPSAADAQPSLEKAKAWVKELQRQANPNIVIALVGNKLDLVGAADPSEPAEEEEEAPKDDQEAEEEDADEETDERPMATKSKSDDLRQVSTAEAEAYAKESGLLFFEASAKTGQNVNELFTEIGPLARRTSEAPN